MLDGDPLAAMLMSPTIEEIREHLRCLRNIAERDGTVERLAAAASGACIFRRDGDTWTVAYRGRTSRLRDSLGLRYLAVLLGNPGRAIHALEIVAGSRGEGAGLPTPESAPLLDARARTEYRARLADAAEELEEARRANDIGRREALQREIETLTAELGRTIGLGGRPRLFASEAERARLNVTRAIRGALGRIASADPALGDHLARAVRTGGLCSYDPDPAALPQWELRGR